MGPSKHGREGKEWDPRWMGFTCVYFAACLFAFRDFGVTWDEPDIYNWGQTYLDYYLRPWTVQTLTTTEGATHNYIYPALLHLLWPNGGFAQFHLLNLFFGFLAFAAAYWVFSEIFGKGWKAMAGCSALLLTPRFMGELASNPKDMPFAVLFFATLVGIYLIPKRVKGEGLQAFWIGTLIGITTCVRILGLTLIPVLVLYQVLDLFWAEGKPLSWKGLAPWLRGRVVFWALVLVFSQLWMLMLWPYLEKGYFQGMLDILRDSKDFAWDGAILFMGHMIHPSDRNIAYLPVWWLVTTPLYLLAFFLFAWGRFLTAVKRPRGSSFALLLGTALAVNLALYFILRPVIYNGMRHYLFLLPVCSAIAALGFLEFLALPFPVIWKRAALGAALISGLLVLGHCVKLYPYHYLYFNELTGGLKGAHGRFETDYLGASLKEAAQWTAGHVDAGPDKPCRVQTCASPEQQTYYFKPGMKGANDIADPDYRIAVNVERDFQLTADLEPKVVHVVEREGVPLAYVLKLR